MTLANPTRRETLEKAHIAATRERDRYLAMVTGAERILSELQGHRTAAQAAQAKAQRELLDEIEHPTVEEPPA